MNTTSPSILIIDDDPDLLDMYREVLCIDGVNILSALSGKAAFDICKSDQSIQVIISDANMGEMSGMELLVNLKGHYQSMPVFYLLTGAFNVTEEEVVAAGGRGLILKPFDLDEILERIKKDIKF